MAFLHINTNLLHALCMFSKIVPKTTSCELPGTLNNEGFVCGEIIIMIIYTVHRLIQTPVHQSFGLVKCIVGLVGLATNGVFGSHIRSFDLQGHCIEFIYYADGIHSGLTPPG